MHLETRYGTASAAFYMNKMNIYSIFVFYA